MEDLQRKLNQIEETLFNHKHLGYDRTKSLDSSLVYSGKVNSGGTTGVLPTGWTVAHNGTGDYTVTHNLGRTLYMTVSTAGTVGYVNVVATGDTTFQVTTYNSSVAATDLAWNFVAL